MSNEGQSLFEYFASRNLFIDTAQSTLSGLSQSRRTELIRECHDRLPVARRSDALTTFDFTVNGELAGAPFPCSSISCRMQNLMELTRFSVLYADSVVLPNPFAERPHNSASLFQTGFHPEDPVNFALLYFLRPLIEAGIVTFAKRIPHFCPDCLAKHGDLEKLGFVRDLEVTANLFYEQFSPKVSYTLERADGGYRLTAHGPVELIRHGSTSHNYSEVPEAIQKRLAEAPGGTLALSAEEITWVFPFLLQTVVDDVYTQHFLTSDLHCHYLTNRDLDVQIIEFIEGKSSPPPPQATIDAFKHVIPFIENVPLARLLHLRESEAEAFRVYKDALSAALKNIKSLDSNAVRELFADTVRPELNKIESIIKSSKSSLRRLLGRDFVVGMGSVAVGLFTGEALGALLTAMGLTSLARTAIDSVREPSDIKKEKYYFLWRAVQLAKEYKD